MWRQRLGEKTFFLSRVGGKKNLPPGGQCATVKSSLQSIHIAEVLFDFYKNKIQLRTKEPEACRSRTAARGGGEGGPGELRSGRGAVRLSFGMWKQVSRGTEGRGGG